MPRCWRQGKRWGEEHARGVIVALIAGLFQAALVLPVPWRRTGSCQNHEPRFHARVNRRSCRRYRRMGQSGFHRSYGDGNIRRLGRCHSGGEVGPADSHARRHIFLLLPGPSWNDGDRSWSSPNSRRAAEKCETSVAALASQAATRQKLLCRTLILWAGDDPARPG